ncbi:MAG: hypothetical protein HQ581_22560 [Planctomycetes bacterium]|nr:hypothetical protein [Planctomycetota bacterium]
MSAEHIEEAVLAAINFFNRMYEDKGLKDVLMEEVREMNEDTWEVTIGYSRVVRDASPMMAITQGAKYERVYKVLAVDKATGNVTSMVLRTV